MDNYLDKTKWKDELMKEMAQGQNTTYILHA
jgi:hypothetical protein